MDKVSKSLETLEFPVQIYQSMYLKRIFCIDKGTSFITGIHKSLLNRFK